VFQKDESDCAFKVLFINGHVFKIHLGCHCSRGDNGEAGAPQHANNTLNISIIKPAMTPGEISGLASANCNSLTVQNFAIT
jgi:hypothetical protein